MGVGGVCGSGGEGRWGELVTVEEEEEKLQLGCIV